VSSFRVLASPRVWGPILGMVVVLALIFYAYLAAVVSPKENLARRKGAGRLEVGAEAAG
jgi:hypothetical protein